MTVREFMRLLRSQLVWVIVIPIICALSCYGYTARHSQTTYTASARITTNANFTVATGFASSAASNWNDTHSGSTSVDSSGSSSNATITISAHGANSDASIAAANEVAATTAEQITTNYPNYIASVTEATTTEQSSRSPKRYALIGLVAGLCAIIIVLLIWDAAARRIHDWQTVEHSADLRYLGSVNGNRAQRELLAASVRMAAPGDSHITTASPKKTAVADVPADREAARPIANSVCLVPVGRTKCALGVARQLKETTVKELSDAVESGKASEKSEDSEKSDSQKNSSSQAKLRTLVAQPFSEGSDALVKARKADSTVLVVQQEKSSYKDLDQALRELDIAGVRPVGFIYVSRLEAHRLGSEE